MKKPFKLANKILLPKRIFSFDEAFPALRFDFYCANCKNKVPVEIVYLEGVDGVLKKLYDPNKLIDRGVFLKNGAAYEANTKSDQYDLVVSTNLVAKYQFVQCDRCDEPYILIYGSGESQPGRNILDLSGIWNIEFVEEDLS